MKGLVDIDPGFRQVLSICVRRPLWHRYVVYIAHPQLPQLPAPMHKVSSTTCINAGCTKQSRPLLARRASQTVLDNVMPSARGPLKHKSREAIRKLNPNGQMGCPAFQTWSGSAANWKKGRFFCTASDSMYSASSFSIAPCG